MVLNNLFSKIKNCNIEDWIAVFVLLALCFVRLAIAAGNIFFLIAYILLIIKLYKEYKKGTLCCQDNFKPFFKIFGIFGLCLFPSVLVSEYHMFSLQRWLEFFITRFMPFVAFAMVIKNIKYARIMLIMFLVFFSADCLTAVYQVAVGATRHGNGFSLQYLHLAGIITMIIPMLMVGVLDDYFNKKERIIFGVFLLCAFLGLGAGFSRGACIFTAILYVLVLGVYGFRKSKLVLGLILVSIILVYFGLTNEQILQRLVSATNTTTNGSNIERFNMWRASIAIFKDYPLFGCGLGTFKMFYADEYILQGAYPFNHAHSNYFHMLAETGIVGFVGFMIFNIGVLYINLKKWLESQSPYRLMLFFGWLGFLLYGIFEHTIGHGDNIKIWWFLLGGLLTLENEAGRENDNETKK